MIDTHAHLNFSPFKEDPEPYIERAVEAGLQAIIVPGIDLKSSEEAIKLAERFPMVYAAVGVHPHDCVKKPKNYIKEVEDMLGHPKVVALGEIGMDFFRDYAPGDIQMRTFREQIALAKSMNMPMIVHDRSADEGVWEALSGENYWNLQAHCHTGTAEFALKLIEMGSLVSFTNVITFSSAKALTEVVAALPLDKLMIETDSPFMAPKPWRGKTCEPFMVKKVAEKYAEIFERDLEEVQNITRNNAIKFFSLTLNNV